MPDIHPSTIIKMSDWARDISDIALAMENTLRGSLERMFYSPVGTEAERQSSEIWPGAWVDVTGYNVWYFGKWWHTGADLNLNVPKFDSDAHAPVFSIGPGVIYAVRQFSGWGNVVCIDHGVSLSRYAHVEKVRVKEGQPVTHLDQVANIGNAGGRWPYHLHFDIARPYARMLDYPGDWPAADRRRVIEHYISPVEFLRHPERFYD